MDNPDDLAGTARLVSCSIARRHRGRRPNRARPGTTTTMASQPYDGRAAIQAIPSLPASETFPAPVLRMLAEAVAGYSSRSGRTTPPVLRAACLRPAGTGCHLLR